MDTTDVVLVAFGCRVDSWKRHVPGQEVGDPIDRMVRDIGEDVEKIGFGIQTVQFCRSNQAVDRGCPLAASIRASKQVIFPPIATARSAPSAALCRVPDYAAPGPLEGTWLMFAAE